MKNATSLFLFAFVILAFGLHSCNSVSVTKRQYNRGYHVDWAVFKKSPKTENTGKKESRSAEITEHTNEQSEGLQSLSGQKTKTEFSTVHNRSVVSISSEFTGMGNTTEESIIEENTHYSISKDEQLAGNQNSVWETHQALNDVLAENHFSLSFSQKMMLKAFSKKAVQKSQKSNKSKQSDSAFLLLVIITLLLPPLGMFLHEGGATTRFWISLLLTLLLFWLPGVIYSLYYVITEN